MRRSFRRKWHLCSSQNVLTARQIRIYPANHQEQNRARLSTCAGVQALVNCIFVGHYGVRSSIGSRSASRLSPRTYCSPSDKGCLHGFCICLATHSGPFFLAFIADSPVLRLSVPRRSFIGDLLRSGTGLGCGQIGSPRSMKYHKSDAALCHKLR